MKLIFVEAVPYLTILTLNVAIVRKIVRASNFRRTFTDRRRKSSQNEVQYILQKISGMFLSCVSKISEIRG